MRRSMELFSVRRTLVSRMIPRMTKILGGIGKIGKRLILAYIVPKNDVLKELNLLPKRNVLLKENRQKVAPLRASISEWMISFVLNLLHRRGDLRLFSQVNPQRRFRSFPCRIASCLVSFEDFVFFKLLV